MKRRYSGGYNLRSKRPKTGFYSNIAKAIGTAANVWSNYRGGRTQLITTPVRKYTTSGSGVTSQYDKKTIYYKKRMPRYKRRRWVSFVKKVRSAVMKDLGTRTIIRNNQLTGSIADDTQNILACSVYGADGLTATTNQCGHGDLREIFTNEATLVATSKALFGSAVLDITMTNQSTLVNAATYPSENTSLEIDVYELMYRKKADATWIGQLLLFGANNTDKINSANPEITIGTRGATPFDLPDALALGGVNILKKTKYFLSAGQCATYQFRDPRNRTIQKDVIDDADSNYILPYVTKTFLIVYRGVPTGNPTQVLKTLQVGVTRKYMYKVQSREGDWDNVLP